MLGDPTSFDVALTTYDMILSQDIGHSLRHTVYWRYLVLDEGHKVPGIPFYCETVQAPK